MTRNKWIALLMVVAIMAVAAFLGACQRSPFFGMTERGKLLCAHQEGNCVEAWSGADITMYSDEGATQTLQLDGALGGIDADGTSNLDEVDIDGVTNLVVGTEHIGVTSILDSAVTYESSGALWTVTSGEIWIVHTVVISVTTNFDCTGDNCTLQIGDGNDANGLLDLVDAEMQAADTEGTGFATGWQGQLAATRGAYLVDGDFIYAPLGGDETIDIAVGGTDPAAGVATIYILYTRIQ